MDTTILEAKTRTRNQIPEHARRQDLAWGSQLSNASCDVYGNSADIIR